MGSPSRSTCGGCPGPESDVFPEIRRSSAVRKSTHSPVGSTVPAPRYGTFVGRGSVARKGHMFGADRASAPVKQVEEARG